MPKAKTAELLKKLNERIDEVQNSDEFKEILKFFSKFHNYSYHNSILIMMQKPEATLVAGYKQWQKKFDRHVKKGEKGIAILAPFTYKKKANHSKDSTAQNVEADEVEIVRKTYFRPVYVFDVSQTEGKPLPAIDFSIENTNIKLLNPLQDYAANKGIDVSYKELEDGLNGYSKGGEIVIDMNANDTEQAAVMAHELAHELLHFKNDSKELSLTREVLEMEAEAVSFVVMDYFGVEIRSDKYLALYKQSYDLMESFKRINEIGSEMLNHMIDYQNKLL